MAYIIQNLVAADQRLQIGAEEVTRQINIGTAWTKIRIGVRLAMNSSSTFGPGGELHIGVCQGLKGKTAVDCTDAVGAQIGNPSYSWTYALSGSVGTCYPTSFNLMGFRKVGPAIQLTGNTGSYATYIASTPGVSTNSSGIYVDILKTATGAKVSSWVPGSAGAAIVNLTRYQFLANMESENAVASGAQAYSLDADATLAFTSSMLWDSVLLSWSRSIPVLDIHDLTVLRFY